MSEACVQDNPLSPPPGHASYGVQSGAPHPPPPMMTAAAIIVGLLRTSCVLPAGVAAAQISARAGGRVSGARGEGGGGGAARSTRPVVVSVGVRCEHELRRALSERCHAAWE